MIGTSAESRRRGSSFRSERQELLDADVMLPGISEIVLMEEAPADPPSKVGQSHLTWIVGEANATDVSDTVFSTVNHEAVQVLVIPAKSRLKRAVQVGDGVVVADEQAPPDERADAAEN